MDMPSEFMCPQRIPLRMGFLFQANTWKSFGYFPLNWVPKQKIFYIL